MPTLASGFPAGNSAASTTLVDSPVYSVTASQVLIAYIGAFTTLTLALGEVAVTGGTITWTRINTQSNAGTVELWKGIPSANLTGVITELTYPGAGAVDGAIVIYAFDSASQTLGANIGNNSGVGAATLTINAQAANSYIVGGGADFTGNAAITADANSTKDFEAQVGDTYFSLHKTALTGAPGNTTFGTTAPSGVQWAMVGAEVKDAPTGTVQRLLLSLGVGT